MAVQLAILVAIWHMLTTGSLHEDLGPDHFERHARERRKRHLVNQLRKMGVELEIKGLGRVSSHGVEPDNRPLRCRVGSRKRD